MTPEQNKLIEQAASKKSAGYTTCKKAVYESMMWMAEYVTNLSPGGWVRGDQRVPDTWEPKFVRFIDDGVKSLASWNKHHEMFIDESGDFHPADQVEWYDEAEIPSDKDKDLTTNELFKFFIKNEPVNFYLANILRLPEEKQIQLKDALADRLPKDDKDKEIERLMGIINHVHNLAADDIPDGVGPCEDAARKIIDIDAYLTEALNTKEV